MARAQASDTGARGASDAGARGVNSTGARGVSGVGARGKSDIGSCGASGVASDASVSKGRVALGASDASVPKGRVALGMSGGVDSSAAAVVLMADGWEAVGVTCVFHDDARSEAAVRDAAAVCRRLGIPHTVRDSTAVFQRCVVEPFVRDYATGLTPSPCVGCNATCKVPELLVAADELGCSHVATGHYARIAQRKDDGRFLLRTALDDAKDQSYMLALLSQEQLSRLLLPLGGATKLAVRAVADDAGLPVAQKPESQDICFVEGSYADFLESRGVTGTPGEIVDAAGRVLGEHQGLFRYTVGQRKGLGIGGAPEPYFVVEKRPDENRLVVGFKDEAFIRGVEVGSVRWQSIAPPEEPLPCMVKLRYRSIPCACTVEPRTDGGAFVRLESPQPTTAPGQCAVFYAGTTVLGGGVIAGVARGADAPMGAR